MERINLVGAGKRFDGLALALQRYGHLCQLSSLSSKASRVAGLS